MGYEYKLLFQSDNSLPLDSILRNAPYFAEYNEQYKTYNFRKHNPSGTGMPDMAVAIENYGLYLIVNLEGPQSPKDEIIAYLQSNIPNATLDSLG